MAIDLSGNITLDRAADLYVPFSRFSDAGVELDISAANLRFIVQGGFQLTPGLDAGNAKGRLLHFTEAHAQSLGGKPRSYMLLLTEGDDHTVLLRGMIAATGWAA